MFVCAIRTPRLHCGAFFCDGETGEGGATIPDGREDEAASPPVPLPDETAASITHTPAERNPASPAVALPPRLTLIEEKRKAAAQLPEIV